MHRSKAASSFDRLVGKGEQAGREREAECLRGFQVDNQLELDSLHDRQVARLLTL